MFSYISALVILTVLLVVNILGPNVTHIDMRYFDIVLHLLGGAGLGFFFAGLTASFRSGRWHRISSIILLVGFCGIVWELFEIYYDITGYTLWTRLYYLDTAKDLINDALGGGLIAWFIVRKKQLNVY